MYCPICGKSNAPDFRFCPYCGTRLPDLSTVASPATVPAEGGAPATRAQAAEPAPAPTTGRGPRCKHCGKAVAPGANPCPHCGGELKWVRKISYGKNAPPRAAVASLSSAMAAVDARMPAGPASAAGDSSGASLVDVIAGVAGVVGAVDDGLHRLVSATKSKHGGVY